MNLMLQAWGVFLEGPEKCLHLESRSKMSNLTITELFYSHILNMNSDYYTRSFECIHLSVFRYRLNGFVAQTFPGAFMKQAPGLKRLKKKKLKKNGSQLN